MTGRKIDAGCKVTQKNDAMRRVASLSKGCARSLCLTKASAQW